MPGGDEAETEAVKRRPEEMKLSMLEKQVKKISYAALLMFFTAVSVLLLQPGKAGVHAASVRESLPVLKLKQLAETGWVEGGSYLEGGTAVSNAYLVTFLSRTASNPNPISIFDMNTWKVAATVPAPVPLSHANDMCFVPKRGETPAGIYVTPMDRPAVIVLNENLSLQRVIDTPQNYHAIGYDERTDSFAAVYVTGTGTDRRLICDILDGSCTSVKKSFPVDMNLTYQGLTIDDSLIYYTGWERGGVNSVYEPVFDGVFEKNDNVIFVYDSDGNLIRELLVTMPEGYSKFELETVSFAGNRMILQFNEKRDDGTDLIGIYEVVGEWSSIARQKEELEAERKAEEEARRAAEEKAAEEKAAAEKAAAEKAAAQYQEALKKLKRTKVKITGIVRKKKSMKLTWKRMTAGTAAVTGYEIQICRKKSFRGSSLHTFRTGGTRCTLKGLRRRTLYYVRIRAYVTGVDGTVSCSAWSSKKKARTK